MKSLLLAASLATLATITSAYVCDIPTAGCDKGMFNQASCKCDCIKPFCADAQGECTVVGGSCVDPWEQCERGVNCPWWVNPAKAEACATGPTIPPGMWQIYNEESFCCKSNFPYSENCSSPPATTSPTKHPTISRPEDNFEAVPIKFEVMGIPEGIDMAEMQGEMLMVLKRIILRLAERIQGLKISSVEEKAVVNRRNKNRRNLINNNAENYNDDGGEGENEKPSGMAMDTFDKSMIEPVSSSSLRQRFLQETTDAAFYYNIMVVRDENKKFGPIIIQEMRDSYKEILEQIQTFSDIRFFSGEVELNWCAYQNGKYELCVQMPDPPPPARAPTPIYVATDPESEGGGLGGGAIAGISISILILLCCIGYLLAVFCFGVAGCFGENSNYNSDTKINNNMYWEDQDNDQSYRSERSRDNRSRGGMYPAIMPAQQDYVEDYPAIMDDNRTQATGYSRRTGRSSRKSGKGQIALTGEQPEGTNDDSFTINTRGTTTTRRTARDPTMYIPGQEDKPDPDSNMLMIEGGDDATSGSRKYIEDPPIKPKRDPTMYVQGGHGDYSAEDPPLKAKRDPTMYVDGQMDPDMYMENVDGRDPTMYVEGGQDASMYVEGGQDASMYGGSRGGRSSNRNKNVSHYSEASVEEMYNDDHNVGPGGNMHGIDEDEEYDQYGFRSSQFSDANGGGGGGREPSYYEDANQSYMASDANSRSGDMSFRTQEPSDESLKSKKSKSKKGGGSRKGGKKKKDLRKSLQSNWGSSAPDVSGRSGDGPHRDVKSFYN